MKKILTIIMLSFIFVLDINASEQDVSRFINDFQNDFNNGMSNTLNYFEDTEYKEQLKDYLGSSNIYLSNIKIAQKEDTYYINSTLSAHGEGKTNWETNGFTVKFTVQEKENKYVIIDTTLFEQIGSEYIAKSVILTFIIVFSIILIVSIIIIKKFIKVNGGNK